MKKTLIRAISSSLLVLVAACTNNDPGPLAGRWSMTGPIPMTVQFRPGETEAMGIIEKVSYKTSGSDVLVTYESGLMKGTSMRYTMVGKNTVRSELGTLQRTN